MTSALQHLDALLALPSDSVESLALVEHHNGFSSAIQEEIATLKQRDDRGELQGNPMGKAYFFLLQNISIEFANIYPFLLAHPQRREKDLKPIFLRWRAELARYQRP